MSIVDIEKRRFPADIWRIPIKTVLTVLNCFYTLAVSFYKQPFATAKTLLHDGSLSYLQPVGTIVARHSSSRLKY